VVQLPARHTAWARYNEAPGNRTLLEVAVFLPLLDINIWKKTHEQKQ